ncbi:hypothetical protein Harman_41930 [Haloarcula mannanilytica]|uniref:Uncharacterized protein n=1 Tax=Haloarcula mannanilytica TaxID=2509225 RepID=A0A4C2ENR9_9EURY|nr:hypothetical protein Harman_41930 [Haloarcula mannanilytica]
MGSKYRHRNRGSTKRKWRWKDRTENRALPQSWADNGCTESPEDGELELYAIQWRAGLLLEWVVNIRTGKLVKGHSANDRGFVPCTSPLTVNEGWFKSGKPAKQMVA